MDVVSKTKGTADIEGDHTIIWKIDELGTTTSEGAVLEFSVEHVGTCTGTIEVNESIDYEDAEGSLVLFENPTIEIECDESICLEECPTPIDITISGCIDAVEYDAGNIYLDSLGRILELNAKIKNVCPNRRVALAVVLTEVDSNNIENKREMKTMVIPDIHILHAVMSK